MVSERLAQVGLTAKGVVYSAVGIMVVMAAFELGGQQEDDASRSGALEMMRETGGSVLLGIITLGLLSYVGWRISRALSPREKTLKRLRYGFSALAYGSVAFSAAKMIFNLRQSNEDTNQQMAAGLLQQPFGEWLVVIAGLILAAVGVYQLYYGWSAKYKKHVQDLNFSDNKGQVLLRAGKLGYIARGIVWLLLAFLMLRAALYKSSSEAGGTGKAFRLIENESWGSLVLAAIGLGLICYAVFSFARARYGEFGYQR